MPNNIQARAQAQAQTQHTITHNNKKAAHGRACEADWDYLAYSEPEARLFLSRAISILFVLFDHAVESNQLCRIKQIRSNCDDHVRHYQPPLSS
jgi:hypothetical protein